MKNLAGFLKKPFTKLHKSMLKDEDGIVFIYVTILLPFIIGLAILAVDASRLQTFTSSLQNAVDTLALDAAAELDLYPDSRVRACTAMKNLANNSIRFENTFKKLKIDCDTTGMATAGSEVEWQFLTSLPPSDRDANGNLISINSYVTSDPAQSKFIRVFSKPGSVNFSTVLPLKFIFNSSSTNLYWREAIAGLNRVSCRPIPLYLCNPWEQSEGITSLSGLKTKVGNVIDAWEWGSTGSGPGPGQFGLADMVGEDPTNQCYASGTTTVDLLKKAFSGQITPCCLPLRAVPPKTGVVANLQAEINTRFDIYKGTYSNLSNLSADTLSKLVPASRSFWYSDQYKMYSTSSTADSCKPQPTFGSTSPGTDSAVMWYPRGTTSWPTMGTYFGKTNAPPSASSVTGAKISGQPTRYETYKYEISQSQYQTLGSKSCFANKLSSNPSLAALANNFNLRNNRREFTAAIVNCKSLPSSYFSGVSGGAIPYTAFGKFFLTEPTNKSIVSNRSTNTTTQKVNVSSNCPGGSGNIYKLTPPTNALPNTTDRYYTMPYSLEWRTTQYIKSIYFEVDPTTYQTSNVSMLGLFLSTLTDSINSNTSAAGLVRACSLGFTSTVSASDTSIYIQSSEFSASTANAPMLFTGETDPYGNSNGPSRSIHFELADVYEPGNGNGDVYEYVKLYR